MNVRNVPNITVRSGFLVMGLKLLEILVFLPFLRLLLIVLSDPHEDVIVNC